MFLKNTIVRKNTTLFTKVITILALLIFVAITAGAIQTKDLIQGPWITIDFHTHTYLTDGSHEQSEVAANSFEKYGLDFLANSEHGGAFGRDPQGKDWDPLSIKILGNPIKDKDGKPLMYRWQSILPPYSYSILFDKEKGLQKKYPGKVLIQGLEWNVPSHEHASIAIVDNTEGKSISNFEYSYDQNDKDTSKEVFLVKRNIDHADSLVAAMYLQENFKYKSYFIINHPSRKQLYSVSDIRDFNNYAPDIFYGLEGMPGHQKEKSRGGYGNSYYTDKENKNLDEVKTARARTYGGADIMLSKVGGLWDSLLGEGRRVWVFANSDFHTSADDGDFWPGEYTQTFVKVSEKTVPGLLAGMKRGSIFIAHGGLINELGFTAEDTNDAVSIGDTLNTKKKSNVVVKIKIKSPVKNNNSMTPLVHHVDLIMGDVTGLISEFDPKYSDETNPSTKIAAVFTTKDLKKDKDGYYVMEYTIKGVEKNCYLRLRGTNLAPNTPNQTDANGNPLNDDLTGENDSAKAYADLWFYSNPIFINAK